MATTFTDATAGRVHAWPLQGRTDSAGVEVVGEHFDGKDAGVVLSAFTGGRLATDAFKVAEDSPAAMTVVVGSGTVGDIAFVEGTDPAQPTYGVAWPDATTDVTVPAADLSNPRIDEVYLVVQDDAYDTSGNVVPRLALRDGTPASSPDAPGPDAAWDAFLLLASILVPAGATEIVNADITAGMVTGTAVPVILEDETRLTVQDDNPVTTQVRAPTTGAIDFFQGDTRRLRIVSTGLDLQAGGFANVGDVSAVFAAGEVDNSIEVASVELASSFTNMASFNLTIPASWNSWKCYATATWVQIQGSVTYEAVLRIDGTDQQVMVMGSAADRGPGAIVGRRTGMTTTGSRQVVLRARETSGEGIFADIALYARAVRTS